MGYEEEREQISIEVLYLAINYFYLIYLRYHIGIIMAILQHIRVCNLPQPVANSEYKPQVSLNFITQALFTLICL